MKIRQGFVSNSSSTSFCIYGVYVKDESTELDEAIAKVNLGRSQRGHYEGLYIGREWSSIGDDETGREFRESVQEMVNKLPIEDKECTTYNGG